MTRYSFLATVIACRLKLSVTRALFAAILLFVVSLACVTVAFGERQRLMMNVGLFCPATAYASELAAAFELYAADTAAVTRYTDLSLMQKDVAAGLLECAYVLPSEFARDARSIDMYVTPDSTGHSVSGMLLASTYMQGFAAEFGYKVLRSYVPGDRAAVSAAIAESNRRFLSSGAFMDITYLAQKSGEAPAAGNLFYAQFGTVALFALLITLLFCYGLVRERKTAVALRLRLAGGNRVYCLGNITAIFLLNLAFFAVSRLMLALFVTGPAGIGAVVAYALFISAFGVCLAGFIKSESLFLGLIILLFLCTAVLGGVFIDVGGILPGLDWTKYLFATFYFMESLKGSAAYLALGVAAAVITGASAAYHR